MPTHLKMTLLILKVTVTMKRMMAQRQTAQSGLTIHNLDLLILKVTVTMKRIMAQRQTAQSGLTIHNLDLLSL
jgi:hypothetical protein